MCIRDRHHADSVQVQGMQLMWEYMYQKLMFGFNNKHYLIVCDSVKSKPLIIVKAICFTIFMTRPLTFLMLALVIRYLLLTVHLIEGSGELSYSA